MNDLLLLKTKTDHHIIIELCHEKISKNQINPFKIVFHPVGQMSIQINQRISNPKLRQAVSSFQFSGYHQKRSKKSIPI